MRRKKKKEYSLKIGRPQTGNYFLKDDEEIIQAIKRLDDTIKVQKKLVSKLDYRRKFGYKIRRSMRTKTLQPKPFDQKYFNEVLNRLEHGLNKEMKKKKDMKFLM